MKKPILFSLCVGIAVIAAAAYFFDSGFHFTEEVQLASGEVIEANRVFKAQPLGEIGAPAAGKPRSTA
jgi:hypothetical protein